MTLAVAGGVRHATFTIRFEDDVVVVPGGIEPINELIPWELGFAYLQVVARLFPFDHDNRKNHSRNSEPGDLPRTNRLFKAKGVTKNTHEGFFGEKLWSMKDLKTFSSQCESGLYA
jgi:hypothetical protein